MVRVVNFDDADVVDENPNENELVRLEVEDEEV